MRSSHNRPSAARKLCLQQQPSSTLGGWGLGPGAGRQQQIICWQHSGPWPQPLPEQSDMAGGMVPQHPQSAGGMGARPQSQPQPGCGVGQDWGAGHRAAPAANSSAVMA